LNIESLDEKSLIESIIKEVMKKLEEKTKNNELERPSKKDKILAIAMSDYKVLCEDNDRYFIDYFDDCEAHIDLSTYGAIILGSMSHQDLVHISIGLASNAITSLIIEAILTGKKIYVIIEGKKYSNYQDTANTNFYNMLKGYEEQLETFGIKWVYAGEIIGKIERSEAIKEASKEASKKAQMTEEYIVQVKIITESLAKQYQEEGCKHLLIKKNTLVTPLARDYLRDHKINMITT